MVSTKIAANNTPNATSPQILPSLSIITVTYNCPQNLRKCLESIEEQEYPKEKIELLIIDGGSTDDTLKVAKSFGATIHVSDEYKYNQEARRGVGALLAKNEILAYIDSDNFLPYSTWLQDMVLPLVKDDSIVGTQTLRYAYRKSDNILNRYFSLFGVNDPVAYYLKKMDRLSWKEEKWNLLGELLQDEEDYYKIRFDYNSLPTIGCNGFLIRKEIIEKAKVNPENFFHIDVAYDLAKRGYDTYGIVKNDIIHYTGNNFVMAVKKRFKYMRTYHQLMKGKRRYKIYDSSNKEDNKNLLKYIVYSSTIVKPTYDAFRGFLKHRDIAWFLHPLMCLSFLFVYSLAFLLNFIWLHEVATNKN